jgi:hypothetical protein
MRRKVGTAVAVVGLVGAFAFVGPGQADSSFKNKYPGGEHSQTCDRGDVITYVGPEMLWPPNHKLQDVLFIATNNGADTSTTLAVTSDVTDEVGGDGGPAHDPDFIPGADGSGSGEATVPAQIRSERSGKGEGRTYTIHAAATFDMIPCTKDFIVTVPHDMGGGADWK